MAFSSGVFARLYNWVNDRNAAINITASRMDAEMDGIATGLSSCLLKDGTQTVTANIPMATYKFTGLGVGTANGDSVRYEQVVLLSAGANQTITRSAAGTVVTLESTDAGASAGPSLALYRNSASPAALDQLGGINWLGKDSGGTQTQYGGIGLTLSDPTDTAESAVLYFTLMTTGAYATELVLSGAGLYPVANDGLSLGLATLSFSDLFLASGGVVNFNNGDVTITHSNNLLTVAGGDLLVPNLEVGNADTTLARASAGIVSVEGVNLIRANATDADTLLDTLGTEALGSVPYHNGSSFALAATDDGAINTSITPRLLFWDGNGVQWKDANAIVDAYKS